MTFLPTSKKIVTIVEEYLEPGEVLRIFSTASIKLRPTKHPSFVQVRDYDKTDLKQHLFKLIDQLYLFNPILHGGGHMRNQNF